MHEACCTCARLLSSDAGRSGSEKEKPLPDHRRLDCCARIICGDCTSTNARFAHYCPYCQISSGPSALPQGGLRAPPSYESSSVDKKSSLRISRTAADEAPPPYTATAVATAGRHTADEKTPAAAQDVLHFLDHERDTVASLSLRYGVPAAELRAANRLPSDALLAARRTVVVPRAGVSLSPRPVGGEDEELRKAKIRRWMVACKEADYEVALLYLEGADYDLALATEAYQADEEWERAHPVEESKRSDSKATKPKLQSLRNRFRFGKVGNGSLVTSKPQNPTHR